MRFLFLIHLLNACGPQALMFHPGFLILVHPLTAKVWPAFILITLCCVMNRELGCPDQICMRVSAVMLRSSACQIKRLGSIVLTDVDADTWTDRRSSCTAQAQYPLRVGVVVAEATGFERGCVPLSHGCSKAKRPLVAALNMCICHNN